MPCRIASRGDRKLDRLTVDQDLARVERDGAGDDLAERRLAGAVLADKGVDLAGGDGQADIVERSCTAVPLAHAQNLDAQA